MKKACIVASVFFLLIAGLSLVLALLSDSTPVLGSKVALVKIEGVLGVDIDALQVIDELKEYRKEGSVKAVVVRINSPGGAVAPSQEIYEAIRRLKKEKYVVTSMGSLAASGGYYIAVASDRIVANPGTMTGSIGVIMELPNVAGLMEKVGIRHQIVKSGKHKDMASVFRDLSAEERRLLQQLLDDVHDQFIEAVADGRGMDGAEIRRLADGRVFTGRQAVELGLVDELGTLEDAVRIAAREGGIEGEPEVLTRKQRLSFVDLLRGDVRSLVRSALGLPPVRAGMEMKYLLVP